ncbi:unnamed protein product [Cladocopium goreaui]|uniref:Uncharacterized protein n=1 Tax=Cladocopium goreaui TaxID=2562237 RepID=A0A9P1G258_9DINO|nr:unnamed protein product [Cladocopium goreaui]
MPVLGRWNADEDDDKPGQRASGGWRQCESSGSDESTSQTGVCSVDLKLSMLESHHQLHGQVDVSEYATNGASVKRIKGALADPQCSCGKCTMPLPVLAKCCKSFWGLPKQQQDAILWSLQSEGSGHALCRSAWLRFLGIGKQRILRTKRKFRGLDERTLDGMQNFAGNCWTTTMSSGETDSNTGKPVRDWAEIAPDSATFKNAYKIRALREGLPGQGRHLQLSERLPRNLRAQTEESARGDLFCLVKHEMSDQGLSQEPLLVWPSAFMDKSKNFLQVANTTQKVLHPQFEDERKGDIEKLMLAMRRDFPALSRAAAWYESLLARRPEVIAEPYTKLSFLDNVIDEGPSIHDFRFAPPRPILMPHRLEVIAESNLGDHLNRVFQDRSKMAEAIDFYVADRFQVPNQKLHLSAIPRGSLEECWLCLRHFDYGPSGKNGCGVEFKNKVFGRKGVFFL